MKKIIISILLTICTSILKAQTTPEAVVKEYVRLLNDWLASPYDSQKKSKVENILQSGGEKCTMKDEIVEKFNSDAGVERMLRDSYLSLLSDKAKLNSVKVSVEILDIICCNRESVTAISRRTEYPLSFSLFY